MSGLGEKGGLGRCRSTNTAEPVTDRQGMSSSWPGLGTALVLLLSVLSGAHCDRSLRQIADAPGPSGSLRSNTKQEETSGALTTTCAFSIKGMAQHQPEAMSREGHKSAAGRAPSHGTDTGVSVDRRAAHG